MAKPIDVARRRLALETSNQGKVVWQLAMAALHAANPTVTPAPAGELDGGPAALILSSSGRPGVTAGRPRG